ncbi:GNAT family N-acetyltransferase [Marivirga lumbricoides]|uniref:GNAT family N-acetyltransferase n=1 Tax=Marivirga lumbricoides TaxID=1046115 RepID=A0A2T4DR28_9BACT|nr:GNAT family N-acetyltransferase [Marivirga lumbricoides]
MEVQHQIFESKGLFFIEKDRKKLAKMTYSKAREDMFIIDHTEVAEALRGTGAGKRMVMAAVNYARENNLKILPLCPFAKSVFDKTEAIRDVLK